VLLEKLTGRLVDRMARIFVSSTFKDLEGCRKNVSFILRQMGHEDVAMEYFVAEDKKPLDKCLEAVASSDLYVGIFACSYGTSLVDTISP
jgi:hypothetical protein